MEQLFIEAGTLMLAGMVFVFAFLGILVVIISTVLAPLANKYPDAKPSSAPVAAAKNETKARQGISPAIVAAITSAVVRYRQQHK
ncbi:OadG family protein [Thalassomonas actiniarum]|nr:OadG family transporter subunit [Thalassomonas actiniarum]